MRNALIGILLGFLLHKGLSAYSSYVWWSNERDCLLEAKAAGEEYARVSDIHRDCVARTNSTSIINYLIITPAFTFQEWTLRY